MTGDAPKPGPAHSILLRFPEPGDIGWVVGQQAALYHREYGWDWTFEGMVAGILAEFVADFDPAREDAWIAERGGRRLGSVFLVKGSDADTAKLRLLAVEEAARGFGLGRRLIDTCIACADELGYRRLTLWTNDVLVSARRIYEAAGFRLAGEAPHHSFGRDLVEQTWILDIAGEAAARVRTAPAASSPAGGARRGRS